MKATTLVLAIAGGYLLWRATRRSVAASPIVAVPKPRKPPRYDVTVGPAVIEPVTPVEAPAAEWWEWE